MNKNILAMDYGASGGRAIHGIYDGCRLELREVHRFKNEPVKLNDTLYWDFPRLFHEMKQALIKMANGAVKDIDGIGVDTWGVDFGLLDKKGDLMSNPVHYRDARTYGLIEEASEKYGAEYIYMATGIQLAEFNTLYQLYALGKQDDTVYKNSKRLLFMPDLFNYFLTGIMKTEFSILSTSQLYDPYKGDWAYDLCKKMGIRTEFFGEIIQPGTFLGSLKEDILIETGLSSADVYAIAGHDTACAVVSVPSDDISGTIYLSSGTWSLMGIESDKPYIDKRSFEYNLTNEGGYGNTFRVLMNIVGLWIYQECRREWEKTEGELSFDELEADAAKCERFRSFIDPDAHIFFEPGRMPEKIREFCKETGQSIPQSKGEIVNVIMQSLAMKYKQVAKKLDDIKGRKHNTINIIGGGCRNVILSQYTADATGKTVYAGPAEATSAGNILVQLMAMGELKNIEEARELSKRSFDIKTYLPEDTGAWDAAYEKYLKVTEAGRY